MPLVTKIKQEWLYLYHRKQTFPQKLLLETKKLYGDKKVKSAGRYNNVHTPNIRTPKNVKQRLIDLKGVIEKQ